MSFDRRGLLISARREKFSFPRTRGCFQINGVREIHYIGRQHCRRASGRRGGKAAVSEPEATFFDEATPARVIKMNLAGVVLGRRTSSFFSGYFMIGISRIIFRR